MLPISEENNQIPPYHPIHEVAVVSPSAPSSIIGSPISNSSNVLALLDLDIGGVDDEASASSPPTTALVDVISVLVQIQAEAYILTLVIISAINFPILL